MNIKSSHFRSLHSGTADQVLIPKRAAPTVLLRSVGTPVINPITGPVTMERPHQRVSINSSQPATISGGFLPVTCLKQAPTQLQKTPALGSFSTSVKCASHLFYGEKTQQSEFAKHSIGVSPGTVTVGRRTTLAVARAEPGGTEVEFRRRKQVVGVTDMLTASKNGQDGYLKKRKQLQGNTEKTDSSLNCTKKFISISNLDLRMYADIIFEEV